MNAYRTVLAAGAGWFAALLLAAACGPERSSPELVSVDPGVVSQHVATPATLHGRHLLERVSVSLDDHSAPGIDRDWAVLVGDLAATEVVRADSETLQLLVPAGLAVGVYDVTVVSPAGETDTLEDALTVDDAPRGLSVSIETAPGGAGEAVGDRELRAGESIELFAVLRNGSSYVSAVDVAWSVEGGIGVVSAGPSATATFEARTAGLGRVLATHPVAEDDRTGELRVVAETATHVRIEDAAGGAGTEVGDLTLRVDEPLPLFAVERDRFENFVRDADVAWSVVSGVGAVSAAGVYSATSPGTAVVRADHALGADETGEITVRTDVAPGPAELNASLVLPTFTGDELSLTISMTVANTGESDASDVTPCALTVGPGLRVDAGPSPASASIPAGGTVTFSWTVAPLAKGTHPLSSCAVGTDAVTLDTVMSNVATGSMVVLPTVWEISADPFGDGTTYAQLFAYDDHIYTGPSADGASALRMQPEGFASELVTFAFPSDVTGNTSRNSASPTFPSIGRLGCAENTYACGPDNEGGLGLFHAASIAGTEWLLVGGVRIGGDLDYAYMTTDATGVLDFSYVDASASLGSGARAFSAVHVFADDVYMGFAGTGGRRPELVRLETTPSPPGLDATTEVVSLQAGDLPGFGSGTISMVDTIFDYADRIYIANAGAWYRATVARPDDANSTPGHWAEVTPTDPAYVAKANLTTLEVVLLAPNLRAIPQMVTFGGRLYAARNTTDGPQIFACEPTTTPPVADCDPDDWALVAPNSTGDPQLTQFDNPGNQRIALLAATSRFLYVGFENAAGVTVFRSDATNPMTRADFEGAVGCPASGHPASCEGIGGAGFGVATNVRIFDALAATLDGTDAVYMTSGNGADPVRVYRLAP